MAAIKDKVLLKDWLAFHPYVSPAQSDLYYLRICNEIHGVLMAEGIEYWENLLDTKELKELACFLAGKDHPLYQNIRGLGEKKSGYYLFEGFVKGENGLFRHLATDRVLEVSGRSMDYPPDLVSGRSVIYAGFVQWGEFWWLTGSMLHYSKNQKEDVNSQLLDKECMLFNDLEGLQAKENKLLSSAFLKFNEGKPMAFRANMDEMNAFVIKFLEYYAGEKRVVPYADPSKGNVPEDVPGMLFCSAVSGIHTVFGLNSCIPDEENPWYNEAEAEDDTERMIHSPYVTGEWMHHLMENYLLPVPEFPGIRETNFVVDNMDFLLRFWKRRAY